MPSQLKIDQVESLREKLQESEALFVCEYRGLNVSKITALRAAIRGAGGVQLTVAVVSPRCALTTFSAPPAPALPAWTIPS